MERISSFGVEIVWNDRFSRGEINCGRAQVIENLRVRNVRGNDKDWMNVTLIIDGARVVLRDVCGLPLGGECEIPTESCTMPDTVGAGQHVCELVFEYVTGRTKQRESVKHTVEVLPDDHICVRMDKAESLRSHVKTSGHELRAFVSEFTVGVGARDAMGKAQGIYDALRMLRRKYELVPRVVREDYQKITPPEETLKYGGSCADLSLLFASLLYAARLEPVLVLMQQHMMAGCWLSHCAVPPVVSDRSLIRRYAEEGTLLLFDCIDVCAEYSKPLADARADALRHVSDPMTAVVLVNVCAREGAEYVGSAYKEVLRSKVFACPACRNTKFSPEMLRESTTECPACGALITVPAEFRTGGGSDTIPAEHAFAQPEPIQPEPDPVPSEPDPVLPERDPIPPELLRRADMAKCEVQGKYAVAKGAPRTAEAVTVPESSNGKPVTKIARQAFTRYKFRAIKLPEGIEEIEQQAFFDIPYLKWVYLPDSLIRLGGSVFGQCTAIEEIYIPKKVRIIPTNAFKGCKALRSVVIAEGVEEIAEGAFADCPALESVQLPSTLKRIGKGAFKNCPKDLELQVPAQTIRDGDIF